MIDLTRSDSPDETKAKFSSRITSDSLSERPQKSGREPVGHRSPYTQDEATNSTKPAGSDIKPHLRSAPPQVIHKVAVPSRVPEIQTHRPARPTRPDHSLVTQEVSSSPDSTNANTVSTRPVQLPVLKSLAIVTKPVKFQKSDRSAEENDASAADTLTYQTNLRPKSKAIPLRSPSLIEIDAPYMTKTRTVADVNTERGTSKRALTAYVESLTNDDPAYLHPIRRMDLSPDTSILTTSRLVKTVPLNANIRSRVGARASPLQESTPRLDGRRQYASRATPSPPPVKGQYTVTFADSPTSPPVPVRLPESYQKAYGACMYI